MKLNRSCKIVLAVLLAAQNFAAVAQTTNAVAPADYPKFIAQRNIFDPNRVPNVPWTATRPRQEYTPPVVRQVDSFTLVGIIGYGEGRMAGVYAFFDGTSADYRKTAQVNDTIANFKITDIEADSVTLMTDTNDTAVLRIGEQLHNDGVGHWLSANGMAARYNNSGGYGRNGRNGRNGFGNRHRNNNYGNGNNGNYNAGNYNNGNFNRRGNYNNAASPASDGSQTDSQNSQADGTAPDNMASPDDNSPPDNMPPPPDDNAPPDANQQNN
jgi:hypothetical protein